MTSIAVIDYGMGNLHSVASAIHKVAPDAQVHVTSDHQVVKNADKVLFPGVGAIRDCMAEIRRLGFDQLVADEIASGKPLLAICVGMQALMKQSQENGGVDCLAHFDGDVEFFSKNERFLQTSSYNKHKVPHMGWNQVQRVLEHPLWHGINDQSRFYFVHSYFVRLNEQSIEAGRCHYGLDFTAAVVKDNVFATQFHPEKSHDAGLQLLKNFVAWDGSF
ncbi:imidazole glycerol phosphate synthase subunit HisH [Agaribacterium haliotis]|uniref:imidazole glycerol phosphate synthase subunit HisH n=1 Tax=Agaribacterium haliotis TaxID=2013869 RepID=UPI000BB591F4|nr:imidazole glycerol phosphate synthase subunit HisH [Agaribacterium haliotis]